MMVYHRHMAFGRYGTFAGGIELPDEKFRTLSRPITACDRPPRLLVPLAPCGGAPAEPVVKPGLRVEAGRMIARGVDRRGLDVFAPLAGKIGNLCTVQLAIGDQFVQTPSMEIVDPAEPELPGEMEETFAWDSCSPRELRTRIAGSALTTFRRRPVPLVDWTRRARRWRCATLVANLMGNEACITSDHRLLVEWGREVLIGMVILARAIEAGSLILAVDRRRTGRYRALADAASEYDVARVALPHKYPTGADRMLVKVLTRKETPIGKGTMDIGVAVIDAGTCLAVYHAVACGQPARGRVVTVTGALIADPQNFWVPFGTDCRWLADPQGRFEHTHAVGEREELIVHGGPMAGLRCRPGAVVGVATRALVAIDAPPGPQSTPCIRCGWCTDHCPARLNVSALNDMYELKQIDSASRAGVLACVGCGVCTYICPARLPLAQRVKQLSRIVRDLEERMPLFSGGLETGR